MAGILVTRGNNLEQLIKIPNSIDRQVRTDRPCIQISVSGMKTNAFEFISGGWRRSKQRSLCLDASLEAVPSQCDRYLIGSSAVCRPSVKPFLAA